MIWAKTLQRKHSSAVCVISKTHWLHLHLTNSGVVRRIHGVHRQVVSSVKFYFKQLDSIETFVGFCNASILNTQRLCF